MDINYGGSDARTATTVDVLITLGELKGCCHLLTSIFFIFAFLGNVVYHTWSLHITRNIGAILILWSRDVRDDVSLSKHRELSNPFLNTSTVSSKLVL